MKLRFFISQSENSSRSKYALLGVAVCLSSRGRATSWLKTESRNCFSQIIPRRLFVSAAALFRAQPCLNFRSGPKGPVSSLPRSLARILFPRVPKIISFQLTRHFTQPSLVQRDPPSPRFNFVLFKKLLFRFQPFKKFDKSLGRFYGSVQSCPVASSVRYLKISQSWYFRDSRLLSLNWINSWREIQREQMSSLSIEVWERDSIEKGDPNMIRIKNGLRSIVLHTRAIRSPLVDLFPPVETALRDESIYLSIGCESKLLFLYFPSDSLLRVMQCTGWKKKVCPWLSQRTCRKINLDQEFHFFFSALYSTHRE